MDQAAPNSFVVLRSVPEDKLDDIIAELMVLFNAEEAHARQIALHAPITLLSRVSEQQAGNARSHMLRLEKLDAVIEITSQPSAGTRSLTWPILPYIATQPANIFICPSCGDRFSVQPFTAEPSATTRPAPLTRPEAEQVEAKAVEIEPVAAEPVETAEVVEAAEVVDALEAPVAAEVVEEEPVAATPPPLDPRVPPGDPIGLESETPSDLEQLFRVSLRQRVKRPQKKQVAALIAKYQGVNAKQAQKLADKALVTILRRVTEEEALACKREFKKINVNVRVLPMRTIRGK